MTEIINRMSALSENSKKVIQNTLEMSERVHKRIISEIENRDARSDATNNGAKYPKISSGVVISAPRSHKDDLCLP